MTTNFVTIIAKTHDHADRFAQEIYPTLITSPQRHSMESAEEGLRGTRNRVIYLVDLDISEILYLKRLHESRNTVLAVYWKEPVL